MFVAGGPGWSAASLARLGGFVAEMVRIAEMQSLVSARHLILQLVVLPVFAAASVAAVQQEARTLTAAC